MLQTHFMHATYIALCMYQKHFILQDVVEYGATLILSVKSAVKFDKLDVYISI